MKSGMLVILLLVAGIAAWILVVAYEKSAPPVITSPVNDANVTVVTIQGTSQAGATIKLYENRTQLGQTNADYNGAWSANLSVPYGTHKITATQTVDGYTSFSSSPVVFSFVTSIVQNPPIPKTALVGEWDFENNVQDTSGNGNNGILYGNVTFAPGKVGQALYFNGYNNYVDIPNNGMLNPGSISISFWIKPDSDTSIDGQIISKFTNTVAGYFVEVGDPTKKWIRFSVPNGITNPNFHSEPNSILYGQWSHVVVTKDSSNVATIYINGFEVATTTFSGSSASSNDLNIGRNVVSAGDHYKGLIDQVRIYNGTLSYADVQALFLEGSTSNVIFQDDYSSNTRWTQVGNQITVNDPSFPGVVKFNNAVDGAGVNDNRVYSQLSTSLPASNWVTDFDYKFTASSIPAAYPLALTTSSANPEQQGTGDAILVYHGASSDVLHVRTWVGPAAVDSAPIPISQNTQYYVRLEKTQNQLVLNVFSDPQRTVQIAGSPIYMNIASTDFGNLNFIQHSTSLSSGTGRTLTAEIDNTKIYQAKTESTPFFFQADYSSNAGWTQVGTQVTVNDPNFPGIVKFNNVAGGSDNRVYTQLSSALPLSGWTAEFDYEFTSSSIPDFHPFVLTSTSANPQLQRDLVEVRHGPDANQLSLVGFGSPSSQPIQISPNTPYFIRLERMPTEVKMSVFSDAARTINVPGSPIIETVAPNDLGNLTFLQHDGCLQCGSGRTFTAQIDNTRIFTKEIEYDKNRDNFLLFQDDYSSNAGWTQIGTMVTVSSPSFPELVKWNNEMGRGGTGDDRVYKQLPTTLPDNWTAYFDYQFTESSLARSLIFNLSATPMDPWFDTSPDIITVEHGFEKDQLQIDLGPRGASTAGIPISPNTQYYVKLQKLPNQLILSVFFDEARTINVPGSPATISIAPNSYNNLNFIQHAGCSACGSGRTLTATLDNTKIFSSTNVIPTQQLGKLAGIGVDQVRNKIYVNDELTNTVSIIDGSSNTFIDRIGVGDYPDDVKVNSKTSRFYIANSHSDTISVFDGTGNSILATIPVGTYPIGIGINEKTNKVYVANSHSDTVSVIDGATNVIINSIHVGSSPHYVAVNPETNTIYVVNELSNSISVIDGNSSTVTTTIPVGRLPEMAVVDPGPNLIYVANPGANSIVTNPYPSTISVINGVTNQVVNTVTVGKTAVALAINTNTHKIYVTNEDDRTMSIVDGTTYAVVDTMPLSLTLPDFVAVNSVTNTIYVADASSNKLLVIDGNSNAIIDTIQVPNSLFTHRPATLQPCITTALEQTRHDIPFNGPVGTGNLANSNSGMVVIASEAVRTDASTPDTNYASQDLIAKCSFDEYGGIDNRKSWLKFDLPVEPSQVKHATLKVYVTMFELTGSAVDVFREDNNNWSSSTITYDNEPAHYASLSSGPYAAQSVSSTDQYYEFDVTNAIVSNPGGKTITLVLVGNTLNNGMALAGSAGRLTAPQLSLDY